MRPITLIAGLLTCLAAPLAVAGGDGDTDDGAATTMESDSRYKESPMLAALVAAGELPPVDERLPEVPALFEPLESVGKYGGTLNSFSMDANPWHDLGDEPERGGYLGNFAADNQTRGRQPGPNRGVQRRPEDHHRGAAARRQVVRRSAVYCR